MCNFECVLVFNHNMYEFMPSY